MLTYSLVSDLSGVHITALRKAPPGLNYAALSNQIQTVKSDKYVKQI